ncbi:MAG: ABC transporter substrate-binding protein [Planctomycetes bacterium]|nr:ABC transporter substrate-binding protein [Planctomycetota bacterium]
MISIAALVLLAAPQSVAPLAEPSRTEPANNTARFALTTAPQSFDPLHADVTANQVLQRQIYEGLVEYAPGGPDAPVQGLLAESWENSADGLRWTFRLRTDARFHDPAKEALWPGGERTVIAQDVVQSWLRMADTRQGPRGYWAMEGLFEGMDAFRNASSGNHAQAAWEHVREQGIAGLRAIDTHTVELRLTRADPWFLNRLASPYFVVYPIEAVDRSGKDFLNQPVGSGPYHLTEWTPGSGAELERVPNWRGQTLPNGREAATIDSLRFRFVAEGSTRTLLFEQGEIDRLPPLQDSFARLLPKGELAPELAERGVNLHVVDTPDLSMLCFNMLDDAIGDLPGDSEGNRQRRILRQAIALAFPYERWHRVIRNEVWGMPARSFLPPALAEAARVEPCTYRRNDLESARAKLAEAGFPNGNGAPQLQLELGGTDPINAAIGEMFREAMEEIGLTALVVPNTWPELSTKMRNGEAQIFLRAWTLDWADPVNLLETFHSANLAPGINRCNYLVPAFDRDLDALRRQPTELRGPLLARAIARLNEDLPAVPIDHRKGYLLVQPWLLGVEVHPFDPFPCKYYALGHR